MDSIRRSVLHSNEYKTLDTTDVKTIGVDPTKI